MASKYITLGIGILLFVGACIAGGWLLDDRYVHAEDAKQMQKSIILINEKMELSILEIKIEILEKEIEAIENEQGTTDPMQMPVDVRKRYKDKKRNLKKFRDQLKALMEK